MSTSYLSIPTIPADANIQIVTVKLIDVAMMDAVSFVTLDDFIKAQTHMANEKFLLVQSEENPANFILVLGRGRNFFHQKIYEWTQADLGKQYQNRGGGDFIMLCAENKAKIRFFGASENCGAVKSEYRIPEMETLIQRAFEDQLEQEKSTLIPDIKWSPEAD